MPNGTIHFNEDAAPQETVLDDGTRVYRACAAGFGCHNLGCGIKVFVKDGVIQKIEGDPDNPISKGRLCIRCLTAKEYLEHADRILYPMKRVGERGENRWERISWDEALETIVENYWNTVNTWGVNSVSVWCGTGREACHYHFTLCNDIFGSVSAVHPNSGWSCIVPRMAIMLWNMGSSYIEFDNALGFPKRYDDPRWECPKYMLLWGRDPLRSNPDGLWGHSIIEMMKRGMKTIVVDPRANWLACNADIHLQLRPGTDAALALGLLNVAINEGLYDHDFVEKWTYGFEQLEERVQEYPPERVAEICDVDPEDIRAAARCLSEKPSTLCMGLPVDQNPNTFQIGLAVYSLFAIYGDMDIPGGLFMGQPGTFAAMSEVDQTDTSGLEGLAKFGNLGVNPLGHDKYPAMSAISNNTHPDYTLDVLESEVGLPYPIKFAYIFANNITSCMVEQPKRWYEALRKVPFIAVCDQFMTPTAIGLADIVLPSSTFLEHNGWVTNSQGSQPGQVGAIIKCVESLGETKSDLEILFELHKRLYPDSTRPEWRSEEAFLSNEFAKVGGQDLTWDKIKSNVIGQLELEYRKYEKGLLRSDGQPGFNTPTGRIELYGTILQQLGEDPLPYYAEPKFSAISRPDFTEDYPLILTTGARRYTSFHSENRHIKTLREIHEYGSVQINPITAKKRGIANGTWVWVENPWGRVKSMAEVTPIVKENVISMDHGWWYPERNPDDMYDVWDYSVNSLIPHEENGPLGFGTHYKSLPATIYPVG